MLEPGTLSGLLLPTTARLYEPHMIKQYLYAKSPYLADSSVIS